VQYACFLLDEGIIAAKAHTGNAVLLADSGKNVAGGQFLCALGA